MFILRRRERRPSFAVMLPVSAGYILSWRRNVSRCRSHRSLSPWHLLCLSPHWSFISNRAQGLQFNPNTSLSPSFSLKCTLKAPFTSSRRAPPLPTFWVICLLLVASCRPYFLCMHTRLFTVDSALFWGGGGWGGVNNGPPVAISCKI